MINKQKLLQIIRLPNVFYSLGIRLMALSGLRTRIVLKADRFKFSIATAYSTTLQTKATQSYMCYIGFGIRMKTRYKDGMNPFVLQWGK